MATIQINDSKNHINLLNHKDNLFPRGKKRFSFRRFALYFVTIVVIFFLVLSYQVVFTGSSFANIISSFVPANPLGGFLNDKESLAGYKDDRINILLLGIGGAGHDGPNLTDTIILASIQPSTNKISLLSIPRDLLVQVPEYGWWKINNVYHFDQKDNRGGELMSQVVSDITGLPIHYYLRVDFNGFEKIIDELDGVKIYVDRSFTDYSYPAPYDKYQTISFQKGWQTMDGQTALEFVRSRHGNNGESGDFARSKRQQKVLQAVKERVFSAETLLSLNKITAIYNLLDENIDTDVQKAELIEFAKLTRNLDTENLINTVLDDAPNGYLYATKYNEAYVLRPKNDSFSQIQSLAQNIFSTQTAIPTKPSAYVEIKNGTNVTGLAGRYSEELKSLGFTVLKIGNASKQDYAQTVIYCLSEQPTPESSQILTTKFNTSITQETPEWVENDADLSTQYYIILGTDLASTN